MRKARRDAPNWEPDVGDFAARPVPNATQPPPLLDPSPPNHLPVCRSLDRASSYLTTSHFTPPRQQHLSSPPLGTSPSPFDRVPPPLHPPYQQLLRHPGGSLKLWQVLRDRSRPIVPLATGPTLPLVREAPRARFSGRRSHKHGMTIDDSRTCEAVQITVPGRRGRPAKEAPEGGGRGQSAGWDAG